MSAFSLGEQKTTNGWVHDNHGSWVTYDLAEMGRVRLIVMADRKAYGWDPNKFGPYHDGVSFGPTSTRSRTCRSGLRYYNPVTGMMEGRAGCSCDFCF